MVSKEAIDKLVREKATKVKLAVREAADTFVFDTTGLDKTKQSALAANSVRVQVRDKNGYVLWSSLVQLPKD